MTAGTRQPEVSVVVPVYNAVRDLPQQLRCLAEQDFAGPYEVVLADNGSTDGLRGLVPAWAAELPYPLRVVDASARRGVAHARNAGCAAARADLIVICDADDEVAPQWLGEMVSALQGADVVGGTLVSDTINAEDVRAWRPMYPAGVLPVKLQHLPYAVGANVGLHRRVFETLGGWDESFVAGGDDVEFSWRAQHARFRLEAAGRAVIRYRLRDSLRATVKQSFAYAQSDALLLRTFRSAGVRRTGLKAPLHELRWLLQHLPEVRDRGGRGLWLRHVAMFAGRAKGSLQHRVWAV